MTRSRAGSLVQSIAVKPPSNLNSVPSLYDDADLLRKLKEVYPQDEQGEESAKEVNVEQKDRNYEKYEKFLQDLEGRSSDYRRVIDDTQMVNVQLNYIIDKFCDITTETQQFTSSTGQLFKDLEHLKTLHISLNEYLSYFESLELVTRELHHISSSSVVKKDSFRMRLGKVNSSLQFLGEHGDFKDAETYRIKFKQCLIRCCNLMANYLTNSIKALCAEVSKSLETTTQSATREALLYSKFQARASDFFPVAEQLSYHCSNNARYRDDIKSILQTCYEEYFQVRTRLLHKTIVSQLNNDADNESFSLVKHVQDNLLFFTQLCENEYKLVIQFFPEVEGRNEFNRWLFRLCEPLHDSVREKVLKENEVAVLCDSVTLLNKFYEFEENSKEYQAQYKSVQLDKILEPLLQDIQYRLIFRAQIYVESHIVNFKPSKDAFMINHRKAHSSKHEDNNDIVSSFLDTISDFEGEVEEIRSCYPPVLRAVALLSRIYQMVHSSIFDNLAHHIVHDCIESLRAAFRLVEQSENALEPRLAYLKNLLMLRKQVQNFEIQYVCNEKYVDFSGLTEFLRSLARGGLRQDSGNSVLDLALERRPRVVNDMVDARSELTLELRNGIKILTDTAAREIIGNCLDGHENLLSNNVKLKDNIETLLPRIHERLCNFIQNVEVRAHLIDAIQELVIRSYAKFYDTIAEDAENGRIDKAEVSELIYVDVLADYINNVASALNQI
ncbi:LADA_0A04214g1_1 [Lachancea dasiensis]|uniref:Conserved oligomeric Golgi complex subunit 3 n=1 Tax=Lachancea dasiensis TaxID=1072105 RepID=A0A1G4INC4_9SACH|nr:LADA_0A04214g1_1 [Lachancea dasiensis]